MSSDAETAIIMYWYRRHLSRRRKYWIHPSIKHISMHSASFIAAELIQHPDRFQNCYRMSPDCFKVLLKLVEPQLTKNDTHFRKAIKPEEKLLITLR
jgi:hypothetical protein